jgi:hypothetical protein
MISETRNRSLPSSLRARFTLVSLLRLGQPFLKPEPGKNNNRHLSLIDHNSWLDYRLQMLANSHSLATARLSGGSPTVHSQVTPIPSLVAFDVISISLATNIVHH